MFNWRIKLKIPIERTEGELGNTNKSIDLDMRNQRIFVDIDPGQSSTALPKR